MKLQLLEAWLLNAELLLPVVTLIKKPFGCLWPAEPHCSKINLKKERKKEKEANMINKLSLQDCSCHLLSKYTVEG